MKIIEVVIGLFLLIVILPVFTKALILFFRAPKRFINNLL